MNRLPDLNDLYYFSKVVEEEGFSAAAGALGIANSVLSEHIARLESSLGVRLLERTTRQFRVTEIGARFYDHCRVIGEEARRALQEAENASSYAGGTLHFVSPAVLAEHVIGPVLSGFLQDNPEVNIVFDVFNKPTNVVKENYDVTFRLSHDSDDSTLVVRPLTELNVMLCASVEFVEKNGVPRHPSELEKFDIVSYPDDFTKRRWVFYNSGTTCTVRLNPRIVVRSVALTTDIVERGVAIGVVPRFLGTTPHRADRLVEVLPDWSLSAWTVQAVYPSRQGLKPAARLFLKYLSERVAMPAV